MTAASARRACLVLASYTGWGLRELEDLDIEELDAWMRALSDKIAG